MTKVDRYMETDLISTCIKIIRKGTHPDLGIKTETEKK